MLFVLHLMDLIECKQEVEIKFDAAMKKIMNYCKAPGAQLAVAKGGELKYFKGFGFSNVGLGEPVTTDLTVMRYNSVTKAITGTAILKLVQEGKLNLSSKAFGLLTDLEPPRGTTIDDRIYNITIQNLLQHTGGWRGPYSLLLPASGHPLPLNTLESGVSTLPFTLYISHSLGEPAPPLANHSIRFMKGQPLDFEPGTAMAYSSFGYNVLDGGHARYPDIPPDESRYYGENGKDVTVLNVYPWEGYTAASYGAVDYDNADSTSAYVGNAADMVRFVVHVDGLRQPGILNKEMVQTMLHAEMPADRIWAGIPHLDHPQGLQWFVTVDNKGVVESFEHAGGAPGSFSYCLRLLKHNVTMAFLLNTYPSHYKKFVHLAALELTNVAKSINTWPPGDLF
eukprot:Gb_01778 [translate_table: standard]